MKPTQEQVIAWAQESGALIAPLISLNDITFSPASLQDFAALAYEAGRKDENEAAIEDARTVGGEAGAEMEKLTRARMKP